MPGSTDLRSDAHAWAAAARHHRAELRREMRSGALPLASVLGADPSAEQGRVTLLFVLESLPGARKVDTRRHLDRLGIDGSLRLRDLDDSQRRTLRAEFPLATPAEDPDSGLAPAATDTAPAATDTAPAATDTAPAVTDTAPAATDTAPAATDTGARQR